MINIAVISHPARKELAIKLYAELTMLIGVNDIRIFSDLGGDGCQATHRRALKWAASRPKLPTIIMEDDAEPVRGFSIKCASLLKQFPGRVISFYLGTSRPPQYQPGIQAAIIAGNEYMTLPTLIHGVCYHVPAHKAAKICNNLDPDLPSDYSIGAALGEDVIYPTASLVDHADVPTIETHPDGQPRNEPRKAWKLASPTIRQADDNQS